MRARHSPRMDTSTALFGESAGQAMAAQSPHSALIERPRAASAGSMTFHVDDIVIRPVRAPAGRGSAAA